MRLSDRKLFLLFRLHSLVSSFLFLNNFRFRPKSSCCTINKESHGMRMDSGFWSNFELVRFFHHITHLGLGVRNSSMLIKPSASLIRVVGKISPSIMVKIEFVVESIPLKKNLNVIFSITPFHTLTFLNQSPDLSKLLSLYIFVSHYP